ncbi:hypothetical protein [Kitasatospora sp. McL0602]|uniref:hypothetical protein n=1 Tax=Kitasatospora sp. McL0602 TaxID=3439530 RepID=UPI003F8A9F4E
MSLAITSAVSGPLPLPGYAWALWRRHRSVLLTVTVVFALIAVGFLMSGLIQHAAYDRAGLARCNNTTPACVRLWKPFIRDYGNANRTVGMVLYFLPGAIGAFVGGPLVAREFEAGTYRFAWTQGAGRTRWTAGGLLLAGTALPGLGALLGLVLRWWNAPLIGLFGGLSPQTFAQGAPAMAGRTLLGFGIGVLAGTLLRRTVAAVGAGVGGSVVAVFVAEALRFHYRAPLTDTVHTAVTSGTDIRWVTTSWFTDPGGARMTDSAFFDLVDKNSDVERLLSHGYALHELYQPESRYWPFQLIEFGWMAVLGVAACAAAVWFVNRRAA